MSTRELTNEQLLDELEELMVEAVDRAAQIVGDAETQPASVGVAYAFLQRLHGVRYPRRARWGLLGIHSIEARLEHAAAQSRLVASHDGFQAFLDEHPELAHADEPEAQPFNFTDEQVFAALVEAEKSEREPWAVDVARALSPDGGFGGWTSGAGRSFLGKTVSALRRLE